MAAKCTAGPWDSPGCSANAATPRLGGCGTFANTAARSTGGCKAQVRTTARRVRGGGSAGRGKGHVTVCCATVTVPLCHTAHEYLRAVVQLIAPAMRVRAYASHLQLQLAARSRGHHAQQPLNQGNVGGQRPLAHQAVNHRVATACSRGGLCQLVARGGGITYRVGRGKTGVGMAPAPPRNGAARAK
jgi:hypothetical protein